MIINQRGDGLWLDSKLHKVDDNVISEIFFLPGKVVTRGRQSKAIGDLGKREVVHLKKSHASRILSNMFRFVFMEMQIADAL